MNFKQNIVDNRKLKAPQYFLGAVLAFLTLSYLLDLIVVHVFGYEPLLFCGIADTISNNGIIRGIAMVLVFFGALYFFASLAGMKSDKGVFYIIAGLVLPFIPALFFAYVAQASGFNCPLLIPKPIL